MNRSTERLVELTNEKNPKLASKTVKVENESVAKAFHVTRERELANKYYKLLLTLVDSQYGEYLSDVIKNIKKLQFAIMHNTGWVVGSKEAYFLESNLIGNDVFYHVIRNESGYHLDSSSNDYTHSVEQSFLYHNLNELTEMHQMFNYRDELVKQVLLFVKDSKDNELVILIMRYINLCLSADELVVSKVNEEDVKAVSRSK